MMRTQIFLGMAASSVPIRREVKNYSNPDLNPDTFILTYP